ncbi:MAG: hypothetical protein J7L23_01320 [Candidatus Diapherotrites archaeon]|nr:hypothetical protein [Candidatus Diapherotrites archaeon]
MGKITSFRKSMNKLDPADYLKRKYELSGWKAELVDIVVGFLFAALLYFIIFPLILGANPPAVIVQSCSMKGALNVGDVVVLQGVSFDEVHAPLVKLDSPVSFKIWPNDYRKETKELIFPNNQTVPVTKKGDIMVYVSRISGEQIIHRVIAKVETPEGRYYITKGDANTIPDAAKIDCGVWSGNRCIQPDPFISSICTDKDKGWPGCIATPVRADEAIGRDLFVIPLIGHIKMMTFHILTLGHGYPGKMWC